MHLSLIFLVFFFSSLSQAGLEKLSVTKLDLDYTAPVGSGSFERLGVGMGLENGPYSFQITRTEEALEIVTPFADLTWTKPLKVVYDLKALSVRGLSAAVGAKVHSFEGQAVALTSGQGDEYQAQDWRGTCEGVASGPLHQRLFEDCRKKLSLSARRIDVPEDFILSRILSRLPLPATRDTAIPARNLTLTVGEGRFALELYLKLVFTAALRVKGDLSYEDDYRTLVLRVDEVRVGELQITGLFLRTLQELTRGADVKVTPPFVRIGLGKLYEHQ